MSPLSNANNNNNTNTSSLSSSSNANNTSSSSSTSAFKPLVSENHRQLSMLSSTVTSASAGSTIDPYTSDLTSAYGSAYHHHHHHLNSQLSTQDYLNVHHQSLPLSVYKSEHDDLQSGYSFARPVKLYEHSSTASSSASAAAVGCGGRFLNLYFSLFF